MNTRQHGTAMTRNEVLKYNPDWSLNDKAVIEELIDPLGGTQFFYNVKGYVTSVRVQSADDQILAFISKGTIWLQTEYKPSQKAVERDGDYTLRLSTHRASGGTAKPQQAVGQVCPTCNQAMSLTGLCDNCA